MKTTHVAVSACAALLATAFSLVTSPAEAARGPSPFRQGGADYTFYKEKGKFGGGLTAGAHYEAFDYHAVCDWLPTPEQAKAECDEAVAPLKKVLGSAAVEPLLTACLTVRDVERKTYCGKDGKSLEAVAGADVTAKLFDKKAKILDLEGYARATSTSAKAGVTMHVAGKKVAGIERAARMDMTIAYVMPIFKAAAGVGVGPLSVSVSAEAVGVFGVDVGAEAGTAGVHFDGAPFASIDVTAGASVGKWLAEVGVEGMVNLADLRLPAEVDVTFADANQLRWSGRADLTFNALSGSIDLYGKLAGKRVGSITLFDWKGIPEKKYEVFEDGGLVSF